MNGKMKMNFKRNRLVVSGLGAAVFALVFSACPQEASEPESKENVDAVTPIITVQPQSADYIEGGDPSALSVTVSVSDGGTLSYQWYQNTDNNTTGGTIINEAISNTYKPNISVIGETYYYVVVTNTNNNASGTKIKTAVSAAAKITVSPDPALEDLENLLASADGGKTAADPVSAAVNTNLGNGGWQKVLEIIESSAKYVALDLSGSTMTGTEFDPDGMVSTGKDKIVSIKLPASAASIPAGNLDTATTTFNGFTSLTTISGENVTTIGEAAFSGCTGLTSVELPKAETIGNVAFFDCTGLTSVSFPATASIGTNAFAGCTSLNSVELPAATTIGEYAFSGCTGLTSVELPKAETIGRGAFRGCTGLNSVSFPATASIGRTDVFNWCTSLSSFVLTGSGSLSVLEGGKALVKDDTELVVYLSASGDITMSTITTIWSGAFYWCTGLTSVKFPKAETIGSSAFLGCTSLTSVELPKAETIGRGAFYRCTGLNSVTLGAKAPTVGDYMFDSINTAKTVTVKVPQGAAGYGQSPVNITDRNWGNGFRGAGWDGSRFVSFDSVNANITVVIEYGQ